MTLRWLAFSTLTLLASAALADEPGDVRVEANGKSWIATAAHWSDGRTTIVVVPETSDAGVPTPEADALAAVNAYISQAGGTCTIDGPLHAIGAEITGTKPGWTAKLNCK